MKIFSSLSHQQKTDLIRFRLNSIFEIDKESLQSIISTENLTSQLIEIPPSITAQEGINTLIALSSNDLQAMYLTTYKHGGIVKFGNVNGEYLINFEFTPFVTSLTKLTNSITFDGHNGICYVKHLKIVSDVSVMLMPSLTIIIKLDGIIIKPQSLSSFISLNQTDTNIVNIHIGRGEFEKLEVSVVDNSNQHDFHLEVLFF